MARNKRRKALSSATVISRKGVEISRSTMNRQFKQTSSLVLSLLFRATLILRQKWRRFYSHALLSSTLPAPLSGSVVVMGKANVYGTGNIRFGENVLLLSESHLETQQMDPLKLATMLCSPPVFTLSPWQRSGSALAR